jgi:hypothetical protein
LHGSTPQDEWKDGFMCSNPRIYYKGKFAEIVPDKKKLPKTKEELLNFIVTDLTDFFYAKDVTLIKNIINNIED